ncbi:hypothetical protein V474_03145 [Novosphingobium barchaimii LL02]|uniref:HTH tetR-type domain-containing protein n=1 Tax=Novosphingobium barchaimii LL02 TaxID=1114963 RepID=A0A0J7XK83_9SPHN|nr:hypothetical protein V474_03145 [Novosphingobium barchaimii LL02]
MLAAAGKAFAAAGYFAVSVEDIALKAGVSRMTFYRNFGSKAALAGDLFRENGRAAMPRLLSIAGRNYRDHAAVAEWIGVLFEADRSSSCLLSVFVQASVLDPEFAARAREFVGEIIDGLGTGIPAFRLDPRKPCDRRRWLEAWLVIYEILDQGNHAARGGEIANDPLVIDILASRFVRFVSVTDIAAVHMHERPDRAFDAGEKGACRASKPHAP